VRIIVVREIENVYIETEREEEHNNEATRLSILHNITGSAV
jgi:hypothetical protein